MAIGLETTHQPLADALALKAPLASPALTGNPTAPTAAPGDNDTTVATTAFVTAALAAAPGLSDGDKGDITVSGSGAAWAIDPDAVTYAKMQNVSATDKVLGRSTAGAGDVEEIACTAAGRALIDDADAAAQRTTLGLGTLATQSAVTEADITLADNTTDDVSIAAHGFVPKAPNDTTKFLRGDGAWAVPGAGPGLTIPAGVMLEFAGLAAAIPVGWLACDGSSLLRATYPDLFLAIGTVWGAVDPGHFTLPDFRDKYSKAASIDGDVADTGGSTSYTPAGTNSAPAFTGTAHTLAGTVAWPAGVPTISGTTINSVTPTINASGIIAWPAGVPTAANESAHTHSVTTNVAVGDHAAHTHTFTQSSNATTPDLLTVNTAAAGVAASGTTGNPSATLSHTVTNNAVTSAAGSAHTHAISWPLGIPTISGTTINAFTPTINNAGSIAWPAGVPTFAGESYTPVGTVAAPVFTGTGATIEPPFARAYKIIKT